MKYFIETKEGKIVEFFSILCIYADSSSAFVSHAAEKIYTNKPIERSSKRYFIGNKGYVFIISPIKDKMDLQPGKNVYDYMSLENLLIEATKIINIWEEH